MNKLDILRYLLGLEIAHGPQSVILPQQKQKYTLDKLD